jgi:hypothetical protein
MLPTDDGKMVIIHVVAADRHAFDTIFADKRPKIKVFEIGVNSREEIERQKCVRHRLLQATCSRHQFSHLQPTLKWAAYRSCGRHSSSKHF